MLMPGRGPILAGLLTLAAAIAVVAGIWWYEAPEQMTVAVAPPSSEDAQLLAEISRRFVSERAGIRLKVIPRDTNAEAGKALDDGDADLAIIRQDDPPPKTGQAIAIFHRNLLVLAARPEANIRVVGDLAGKRIGVIGISRTNVSLLNTILAQYGLAPDAVTVVPLSALNIGAAIAKQPLDALLVAGPITGRVMQQAITAFTGDIDPVFVPFHNTEAIAQRLPAFQVAQIDAGAFGNAPPRPARNVSTFQFSTMLVASRDISEDAAATLARAIFDLRPSLSIDFPAANRIEAADTAKDALLPAHLGAAAYFDGDEKSLFDRFGDLFYIGLAAAGILGSALAGLARLAVPSTPTNTTDRDLFRTVTRLLAETGEAASLARLDAIETEIGGLLILVLARAENDDVDAGKLATLSLALQHLRQVIETRRRQLTHTGS